MKIKLKLRERIIPQTGKHLLGRKYKSSGSLLTFRYVELYPDDRIRWKTITGREGNPAVFTGTDPISLELERIREGKYIEIT